MSSPTTRPRSRSRAGFGPGDMGRQEDVPSSLMKFSEGALLVRVVNKICRDKEGKRARVLVITNYGLFLNHFDGKVNRFVVFSAARKMITCKDYVLFRCGGQFDMVLELTRHPVNTSHDAGKVTRLIEHLSRKHGTGVFSRTSVATYSELMKNALMSASQESSELMVAGAQAAEINKRRAAMQKDHIYEATLALAHNKVLTTKKEIRKKQESQLRDVTKERVKAFYQHYCPERIKFLDDVMFKFVGHETSLINALVYKYGPEPGTPEFERAQEEGALELQRARSATRSPVPEEETHTSTAQDTRRGADSDVEDEELVTLIRQGESEAPPPPTSEETGVFEQKVEAQEEEQAYGTEVQEEDEHTAAEAPHEGVDTDNSSNALPEGENAVHNSQAEKQPVPKRKQLFLAETEQQQQHRLPASTSADFEEFDCETPDHHRRSQQLNDSRDDRRTFGTHPGRGGRPHTMRMIPPSHSSESMDEHFHINQTRSDEPPTPHRHPPPQVASSHSGGGLEALLQHARRQTKQRHAGHEVSMSSPKRQVRVATSTAASSPIVSRHHAQPRHVDPQPNIQRFSPPTPLKKEELSHRSVPELHPEPQLPRLLRQSTSFDDLASTTFPLPSSTANSSQTKLFGAVPVIPAPPISANEMLLAAVELYQHHGGFTSCAELEVPDVALDMIAQSKMNGLEIEFEDMLDRHHVPKGETIDVSVAESEELMSVASSSTGVVCTSSAFFHVLVGLCNRHLSYTLNVSQFQGPYHGSTKLVDTLPVTQDFIEYVAYSCGQVEVTHQALCRDDDVMVHVLDDASAQGGSSEPLQTSYRIPAAEWYSMVAQWNERQVSLLPGTTTMCE